MAETGARETDEVSYLGDIYVTMKIFIDKRNGKADFGVHVFAPTKLTVVGRMLLPQTVSAQAHGRAERSDHHAQTTAFR